MRLLLFEGVTEGSSAISVVGGSSRGSIASLETTPWLVVKVSESGIVMRCEAEVLDDGHLSLAEEVRQQLDLKSGDRVEVTIRRPPASAALDPDNLLVKMIGLCEGRGMTDSAFRHEYYLYHEDQP